mgnify:CR=1 FL=1
MLETALITDCRGETLLRGRLTASRDWSEVNAFCHRAYMPLSTRPLARGSAPDATLRMLRIGRITVSRFGFGVPTRADDFDASAGNVIVVNTIRGSVRHPLAGNDSIDTRTGDSYVVDCSRTGYWNIANGDDLQLNLTIPHGLLEEVALRWYGFVPEDSLWKQRLLFGRGDSPSAWISLVDYAVRSLDARRGGVGDPVLEARIEEMLCLDLLRNWTGAAGLDLETGARAAAPHYVREAERLMHELAADAPNLTEIAAQVGISGRSLSEGFRRFRGITPHQHLHACRLDGLRQALQQAGPDQTVAQVASARGYVNLGAMAAAYARRFGEPPSRNLRSRTEKR